MQVRTTAARVFPVIDLCLVCPSSGGRRGADETVVVGALRLHQENPESAWMELEVLPLEKIAWSSAILSEVHEIASVVDCQHGALGTVVFSAKALGIPWKRSEALPSHRGGSVVFFFARPFHAYEFAETKYIASTVHLAKITTTVVIVDNKECILCAPNLAQLEFGG